MKSDHNKTIHLFLVYNFMTTKISSQDTHKAPTQLHHQTYHYPTLIEKRRSQVKSKIDQVLHQDIEYLRYHYYQPVTHHKLQVANQNKLINEYVHNNYEEYHLLNPLPHLSAPAMTHSQIQDSTKRSQKLEVYSSSKKKRFWESEYRPQFQKIQKFKTQPNIEELQRQPTKRIVTYQNLQKQDRRQDKANLNMIDYSRSTKRYLSTNPTQNKIYYSLHRLQPSDFSIKIEQPPTFEQSLIQSHYINEGIYPRFTFNRENQVRHPKEQTQKNPFMAVKLKEKTPQLYSEKFRYCVGCEKSLLEINIEYHQSVCTQFKQAFSLSFEQLAEYLGTKIQKIQKELLNNKHPRNRQIGFQKQLKQLVEASSQSKKLGFRTGQFLKDIKRLNDGCKMELQDLQRVSKMNWFLQIIENIGKKLKK